MLDSLHHQAKLLTPICDFLIWETKTAMGVGLAKLFIGVWCKVCDEKSTPRLEDPGCFFDRGLRLWEIMQNLMNGHQVRAIIIIRKPQDIGLTDGSLTAARII
jgi:hypothetical protein